MTPPRFITPFVLSTGGLTSAAALSLWRDLYARAFLKVELETPINTPLVASARVLTLPGVVLGYLTMSPVTITRTRADLTDANKAFLLVICTEGALTVKASGSVTRLAASEATVIACGEASVTEITAATSLIQLLVPGAVLGPLLAHMDGIVGGVIAQGTDALQLLLAYVRALGEEMVLEDLSMRSKVVAHIYELIALTVSAGEGVKARGRGKGAGAVKLRTIKADVLDALSRHDLSVEILAEQRSVSPRYVRRLFEKDGTTFTAFVLEHRLLKAQALLTDPAEAEQAISVIAWSCGFSDQSYFNRVFRKRFGITPSMARAGEGPLH